MGFGDNIRRLREERGMTQEQLASRLGVTRTAVTQWESGSTHPRMGSLEAMAALFGVRKSDIVDDVSYGVVPLPTADEMLLDPAIPRVPLRDLRHTSLTLALEGGGSLLAVSRRAGHSSPGVTSAFYLRPHESVDVEVADGLGALLCPDVSCGDGEEKGREP